MLKQGHKSPRFAFIRHYPRLRDFLAVYEDYSAKGSDYFIVIVKDFLRCRTSGAFCMLVLNTTSRPTRCGTVSTAVIDMRHECCMICELSIP